MASLALLLVATAAHAGDAAVEAPIRHFTAAINKGDVKAALPTHIAAPVITDEVAPYLWSGPKALDRWFSDLGASEAAGGISDDLVSLGTPIREEVSGSHAYVVWPAVYTFNQKSVPMRETAQWTFTLIKQGASWKITGWTWSAQQRPDNIPRVEKRSAFHHTVVEGAALFHPTGSASVQSSSQSQPGVAPGCARVI